MIEGYTEPFVHVSFFSELWNNRSHIFDGVTLTSETAAFQLCDITDPMLKQMIEEEEDVRDSCNVGEFRLILTLEIKSLSRNVMAGLLAVPWSASRQYCDTNSSLCSKDTLQLTKNVLNFSNSKTALGQFGRSQGGQGRVNTTWQKVLCRWRMQRYAKCQLSLL